MSADRKYRLEAIRYILSGKELSSHKEVCAELREKGIECTQSMLSRDLKHMNVAKAAGTGGKYVYVLPNDTIYRRNIASVGRGGQEVIEVVGFKSLEFSGNIAVIKTRPGYATALAYDIDNRNLPEVLGTVAGDDTIIMVLREGCPRKGLKHALSRIIPHIV
jgi:transcriptional regulator of arginine metabolism